MYQVLLVDDEVSYRELLKNVFGEQGYDVRVASGGQDALAIATTFVPDVLVVDWMLGDEQDGSAIADFYRNLNPKLGVVFMSGFPNYNLQTAADNDAAVIWLSKPFHLDEVLAAVETVLHPPAFPDATT